MHWFGYIVRREREYIAKHIEQIKIEKNTKRGRVKNTCERMVTRHI